MKSIESKEKTALTSNEWKAVFIFISLTVLFLYQAPYMAVFPMAMLLYVVGKFLLKKLNIINEGSARLGSLLEIEMHTEIPYEKDMKYRLVLKNIEFKAYRRSDERKWRQSRVLAQIDKEVVTKNSSGFSTIKTAIAIPKEGKVTEYQVEQYNSSTYDKSSYYWELEVSEKAKKIINFKRTFEIEVIDKMGTIDIVKRRRKK